MTDLRSWVRWWKEAAPRQLASRRRPSRVWPFMGVFVIGLAAGAIGTIAITQRPHIGRLATRAVAWRNDLLRELGRIEAAKADSVTSHRSNHRRKAALEVT